MAFLLLNLFDLFLTGYIFSHNGMEANGIAAYILTRFHQRAFAIYKFAMVVIIIIICEVVGTKSMKKARLIMLLGCSVYFAVVLYESYLIFNYISYPSVKPSDDSALISYASAYFSRLF